MILDLEKMLRNLKEIKKNGIGKKHLLDLRRVLSLLEA